MLHVTYDTNKKKDNITIWDDSTGFKSTYSFDPKKDPNFGLIMEYYLKFLNREGIKMNSIKDLNVAIDAFLLDELYTNNFDDDCNLICD